VHRLLAFAIDLARLALYIAVTALIYGLIDRLCFFHD
jgi:hypothetical protein